MAHDEVKANSSSCERKAVVCRARGERKNSKIAETREENDDTAPPTTAVATLTTSSVCMVHSEITCVGPAWIPVFLVKNEMVPCTGVDVEIRCRNTE